LPADCDQTEQIETRVTVVPTAAGQEFLLKLSPDPVKQKALWATKLEPLDGMVTLGKTKSTATVYARAAKETGGKEYDLMASVDSGQGRVMVFGGDTTYLSWRRSPEAQAAY